MKILTTINVAADLDRIAMRGARYGFPGWVAIEETKRGTKRRYLEQRHEARAKAVEPILADSDMPEGPPPPPPPPPLRPRTGVCGDRLFKPARGHALVINDLRTRNISCTTALRIAGASTLGNELPRGWRCSDARRPTRGRSAPSAAPGSPTSSPVAASSRSRRDQSDGPVAGCQRLLDEASDQAVLRVLDDLRSLCRAAQTYEQERGLEATLAGFLEQTRVDDVDALTADEDLRWTIATIHSAKGTEAQAVFVLACEERRLPSRHSIESDDLLAVEEERRLFYVAVTRAKDRLVLTTSQERFGSAAAGSSRFLSEADLAARCSRRGA